MANAGWMRPAWCCQGGLALRGLLWGFGVLIPAVFQDSDGDKSDDLVVDVSNEVSISGALRAGVGVQGMIPGCERFLPSFRTPPPPGSARPTPPRRTASTKPAG